METVGVVMVNYNGQNYNKECIDSIFNSNYKNIKIYIIDNCSVDNSVEELEKLYGNKVTLIKGDKNRGFAGATNIGIKLALEDKVDYVLLLNNDTVIDNKMIKNMIQVSKRNGGAVISPKIYYYDPSNIIWSAGGKIKWECGCTRQYGMGKKDCSEYDEEKEVDFATGCCMLIPVDVIKNIGILSEEYFLYFEDTDFCVKLKRNGYKIIYDPTAFMFHKVSASSGGLNSKIFIYYYTRGRFLFNSKFNNDFFKHKIYIFIWMVKNILSWMVNGNKELIVATFDAIKDYKHNKFGKSEKY